MLVPKYALIEHERRFVVAPARCPVLDPATATRLDDWYLDGTRLRLRTATAADGSTIRKLAKKYAGETAAARPMTNLYLDAAEFVLLRRLPGRGVAKVRYRLSNGFVVDVFAGGLSGLILAEIEADADTVAHAVPPQWAVAEVTDDPRYDGGSLSRWTPADVAGHRARYG